MKKVLITALTLVAAGVGFLSLTAFRGDHGAPARMERAVDRRLGKMLDDIQATDAQRQQIQAIKDKVLADGRTLRAAHGDTRQKLLALWNSDQPDPAQVHELVDARAASMKHFADEVADAMIQVHAILTPEQRAKIGADVSRHLPQP